MDPNRGAAAPHEPYRGARKSGLGRATFGPLVWDAEMAPIEKMREGRSTGLGWPLLKWVDATTNRTMVSAVGGALERRCGRAERVGEDVSLLF